jgi:8-oxo-dGTP diphosphatase
MTTEKPKTTRISAVGLIVDNQDRVLLCRLSHIVEGSAGKWTLPGGGVDYGEDPAYALVREVGEETGLTAHIGKLVDVDSLMMEFNDRYTHAIRIIYSATVDPGELKVEQGGSTDACDWFTREQALKLPMTSLAEKGMKLLDWTN